MNKAKVDYKAAVNHLADYYIRDQDFVGGEDISVADLLAFCYLVNLGIVYYSFIILCYYDSYNNDRCFLVHCICSSYVRIA